MSSNYSRAFHAQFGAKSTIQALCIKKRHTQAAEIPSVTEYSFNGAKETPTRESLHAMQRKNYLKK